MTLDKIPVINYGPNIKEEDQSKWQECTICLEGSNDQDLLGHQSGNSIHASHRLCFESWMKRKPSCPICRATFEGVNRPVFEELGLRRLFLQLPNIGRVASSILDSIFPGISDIFRENIRISQVNIKGEMTVAAGLTGAFFITGLFPIMAMEALSGAAVGYLITSFDDEEENENLELDSLEPISEKIERLLSSHSFQMGVQVVAALALTSFAVPTMAVSLETFLSGVVANYGIEKLHERNFISLRVKRSMQKTVAIAATITSIINPMKVVGSAIIGSVIGSAASSSKIISKSFQKVRSWLSL